MRAKELLLEGSPLEAALRRGWVYITYIRLDGKHRTFVATTNPELFRYTYKRPKRYITKRVIQVWDHQLGWRSLRRNRIQSWYSRPIAQPKTV